MQVKKQKNTSKKDLNGKGGVVMRLTIKEIDEMNKIDEENFNTYMELLKVESDSLHTILGYCQNKCNERDCTKCVLTKVEL